MAKSKKSPTANVSTLKVHLGRYLKMVRQGEEIIVLDRQTPIAKLVPFPDINSKPLERPADLKWQSAVAGLKSKKVPALNKNSLHYLNEDRGAR